MVLTNDVSFDVRFNDAVAEVRDALGFYGFVEAQIEWENGSWNSVKVRESFSKNFSHNGLMLTVVYDIFNKYHIDDIDVIVSV